MPTGLLVMGALGSIGAGVTGIIGGLEAQKGAKRAAAREILLSRQQQAAERSQSQRLAASQEAAAGAGGALGGSPLLVQAASVFESLKQQEFIRAGGDARAAALRRQGKQAFQAGLVSGIGGIASGIGTFGLLGRDAGLFGSGAAGGKSFSKSGLVANPLP